MARFLGLMLVPALLGWSVAAAPVAAQSRSNFVNDDAGLFSKDAVNKANAEIAQMRAQFKRELVVDTADTVKVPGDIDPKNAKAVNQFFDNWARNHASEKKVNGVYVAIVHNPRKVRVEEGNRTEQSGLFTSADRQELETQLIGNLKSAQQIGRAHV